MKNLRSQLEEGVLRAWESLTDGWRELLSRSSGALTHFATPAKRKEEEKSHPRFPTWGMLAGETWETAHSVIIRVELPGMNKDDIEISITGNILRIRGDKRSQGESAGRRYHLMERAYGRFERTVSLPHDVDKDRAELSYQDGVITVILPKTKTTPPRHLSIP